MIKDKIEWRYKYGLPHNTLGKVRLGDSCKITQKMIEKGDNQYFLLFTSPPYCGITDYFMDQWLRLWLLGGTSEPEYKKEYHKSRFNNKEQYRILLETVFRNCSALMAKNSCIYVRTDIREFTFKTTLDVLKKAFPFHHVEVLDKPIAKNVRTQTFVCGNTSKKHGEKDIILTR